MKADLRRARVPVRVRQLDGRRKGSGQTHGVSDIVQQCRRLFLDAPSQSPHSEHGPDGMLISRHSPRREIDETGDAVLKDGLQSLNRRMSNELDQDWLVCSSG